MNSSSERFRRDFQWMFLPGIPFQRARFKFRQQIAEIRPGLRLALELGSDPALRLRRFLGRYLDRRHQLADSKHCNKRRNGAK